MKMMNAIVKDLTLLLIIVFSYSNSFAEIIIDKLPYTCNKDNETYTVLKSLISESGNAITINANNIIINGNNKTITFGNSSSGKGILLGKHVDSLTIQNITMIQGPGGGEGIDTYWYTPTNLTIQNSTILCENKAFPAVFLRDISRDINALLIRNNIIRVNDLVQGSAKAIQIENRASNFSGAIEDNAIYVGDNIYKNRNSCISVVGKSNGNLSIKNNTINMNTEAEGEGIRLYGADNNQISGNTINMNCLDCRGILIDGGSDNNKIFENRINMNILNNGSSLAYGVRIRFSSSKNEVFDNTIDMTNSNASSGAAVAIGIGGTQEETPGTNKDNIILHNKIISSKHVAYYMNEGSQNTSFCYNTVQSTGSTEPIFIRSFPDPELIAGLRMYNEEMIYSSEHAIKFDFYYASTQDPVVISNSDITPEKIKNGIEERDFVINDNLKTSPCAPQPKINLIHILHTTL